MLRWRKGSHEIGVVGKDGNYEISGRVERAAVRVGNPRAFGYMNQYIMVALKEW